MILLCIPSFDLIIFLIQQLLTLTWIYTLFPNVATAAKISCGDKPNIYHKCHKLNFIYGGTESEPFNWPWMTLFLKLKNGRYMPTCGGSLLTPNIVISAAHCFSDSSKLPSIRAVIGVHDIDTLSQRDLIGIDSVLIHPDYDSHTTDSDVALVYLNTTVSYVRNRISPLCLPSSKIERVTGSCFSTGWGSTEDGERFSSVLKEVCLPPIPWNECKSLLGKDFTENMICAGDKENGKIDTCDGDSGGPLACYNDGKWELHGIISWGFGCGRPNYPGVSAYVYPFRKWIRDNI